MRWKEIRTLQRTEGKQSVTGSSTYRNAYPLNIRIRLQSKCCSRTSQNCNRSPRGCWRSTPLSKPGLRKSLATLPHCSRGFKAWINLSRMILQLLACELRIPHHRSLPLTRCPTENGEQLFQIMRWKRAHSWTTKTYYISARSIEIILSNMVAPFSMIQINLTLK